MLLPPAIARLYRQSPDAEIRIVEGMPHATLPRVRDGAFDFAIGPLPSEPLPPDIAATALFRIEMAIVVRRGHPQAKARSVTALADYDWMTAGLSSERVVVDDMFRVARLPPPRWRIRCESISALIAIAARTDMVVTMPRPLIALGIAGGLLEIVNLREKRSVASEVFLFAKTRFAAHAGLGNICEAAQGRSEAGQAVIFNAREPWGSLIIHTPKHTCANSAAHVRFCQKQTWSSAGETVIGPVVFQVL